MCSSAVSAGQHKSERTAHKPGGATRSKNCVSPTPLSNLHLILNCLHESRRSERCVVRVLGLSTPNQESRRADSNR